MTSRRFLQPFLLFNPLLLILLTLDPKKNRLISHPLFLATEQ